MEFNLFSTLKNNLEDFDNKKLHLAEGEQETGRYLSKEKYGYFFSQKDTINDIDLAINSIFKTGKFDSEGQRKIYLNKVRFVRDVARMRTDVDVKNYLMTPETYKDFWATYCMSRKFKQWAKEENYGEMINALLDDFNTYGTAVIKQIGSDVERVPLKTLKNTQDAKSLKEAVTCGGYVIQEHEMTLYEMQKMKNWDTEGFEHGKRYKVYEMYCLIPKELIKDPSFKAVKAEYMKEAMVVMTLDVSDKGDPSGKIIFIEETECPMEEAWFEKVDGRWLGRGPVEIQLEHQIATNLSFNLRRKALLHSSKRVYITNSEELEKNLLQEVRDGQVMYAGPNGDVRPIVNETRNIAEFSADDALLDKNIQQTSFTFEVATGESLPSGTPFRLGVILSQAVESYYNLKREYFALFLKRSFFSQIIPMFAKQTKEHTLTISVDSEGATYLKDAMTEYHARQRVKDALLNGQVPEVDRIKQEIEAEMIKSPYFYVEIPDGFYKNIKYQLDLNITDESQDVAKEIETLTTLYQTLAQAQDPRADRVLQTIISKTGNSLEALAGKGGTAPAIPTGNAPTGGPLPVNNVGANANPTL